MSNTTTKQIRTVIDAFDAGKKIEARGRVDETKKDYPNWVDVAEPCWNFNEFEYRIKRELEFLWQVAFLDGSHAVYRKEEDAMDTQIRVFENTGRTPKIQKFIEVIE